MSVQLRTEFTGLEAYKRQLDRLSHFNTTKLLDGIGAIIETQTRRRLSEEKEAPVLTAASSRSGGSSSSWEPLSPKYAARKRKISSGGILELTGSLIDSITHNVDGDEVEIGSNLPYARIHQLGGEIEAPTWFGSRRSRSGGQISTSTHKSEIPARPYLGLSDDNQDEIQVEVGNFLRRLALGR